MTKKDFIKKILESVVLIALIVSAGFISWHHIKMSQTAFDWFNESITIQNQITQVQSATKMMMSTICNGFPKSERIIFNPSADGKKADFGFVCANNPKGNDTVIKTK